MTNHQPISIRSYPKCIIHIDGDSFFASVEQSINPQLKGRPVVTGLERGIASAMSKEAKALGVTRGMPIHEIKACSPSIIILPSNYETYSLYAERIYSRVREFTPHVEEYSIDECFAELTGTRRINNGSYFDIAKTIKEKIESELNLTVSVGIAPSKTLAKIASTKDKPSGCYALPARIIHTVLPNIPIEDVWGIGKQTAHYLRYHGIKTAFDFVQKNESWIKNHLSKPFRQTWNELRGISVLAIETDKKIPKNIIRSRTFTPASNEPSYVISQLSKNIENACIKARRYGLRTNTVHLFLKQQDFKKRGVTITLSHRTNAPEAITQILEPALTKLLDGRTRFRASGVVLSDLRAGSLQMDLFKSHIRIEKLEHLHSVVDDVNKRFGKHTVYLGTSHKALHTPSADNKRNQKPTRHIHHLPGETKRQHLRIPLLGSTKN